jgi:hypothetical protein
MADYYSLIAGAVSRLPAKTDEHEIYGVGEIDRGWGD